MIINEHFKFCQSDYSLVSTAGIKLTVKEPFKELLEFPIPYVHVPVIGVVPSRSTGESGIKCALNY